MTATFKLPYRPGPVKPGRPGVREGPTRAAVFVKAGGGGTLSRAPRARQKWPRHAHPSRAREAWQWESKSGATPPFRERANLNPRAEAADEEETVARTAAAASAVRPAGARRQGAVFGEIPDE